MDEIERRVAAHELALIEVVAHIDRDQIRHGMTAVRAGLVVGISAEERDIRLGALDLLEAALHRYAPLSDAFGDMSLAAALAARVAGPFSR